MVAFTTEQLAGWLSLFLWPLVRVLALFSTAPVFSHRSMPRRIRLLLAVAVTLVLAPSLPAVPVSIDPFGPQGFMLLLQQIIIGAAMGFAMRLVFAGIELAGDIIGLQLGIGFASFIDPQNSRPIPIIGSFLMLIASLALLGLEGHLLLLAGIGESFVRLPVNIDWIGTGGASDALRHLTLMGTEVFMLGVHLSLPVLAAMLVANLVMGLLSRSAPQLNIFSISFPMTLLVGFWVLMTTLPYLEPILRAVILRHPLGPFGG